jgi:peroxiredoxin
VAVQFLDENGAKFPTVLDPSPAAREACGKFETMGRSAVPLTYIIDREGNIADAWYGYQQDQVQGMQTLKKLGIQVP